MATERLYLYREDYVTANSSKVCEVLQKKNCDVIVTEASCFFPEGGGQPSDVGLVYRCREDGSIIDFYEVTHVFDKTLEGDVYHTTNAPAGTFSVGDIVFLEIDDELHFINTARHTGEHMLSGAIHKLFGGVNKGFHMGEDYVTIDIDLGGRVLSLEELQRAENKVNEAIRDNLPVQVDFFESYKASTVMPVRKSVPHTGKVSIVTVGECFSKDDSSYALENAHYFDDNLEEELLPFDCIACCGTHVHNTGEIGLVSIYKSEVNKGMTRIYFDCGAKALSKLNSDSRLLSNISNRFSCKVSDIMHKLDIQEEKQNKLRERVTALSAYSMNIEREKIIAELSEGALNSSSVLVCEYSIFDIEELVKFGFELIEIVGSEALLILIDATSNTVLLYSASEAYKCGALINEFAGAFKGRGGGRDDNARAVFPSLSSARLFAEKVACSQCE